MVPVKRILERCRSFLACEDGMSTTEYAFMLSLIVLTAMAAIAGISSRMENITDIIEEKTPTV